jgi:hypothetical protein
MSAVQQAQGWWGKIRDSLPSLNPALAVILLVVNIFLPGLGTMILGCLNNECNWNHIVVGLLQLLLAGLIVGWIWSIWWGILLVQKSART